MISLFYTILAPIFLYFGAFQIEFLLISFISSEANSDASIYACEPEKFH